MEIKFFTAGLSTRYEDIYFYEAQRVIPEGRTTLTTERWSNGPRFQTIYTGDFDYTTTQSFYSSRIYGLQTRIDYKLAVTISGANLSVLDYAEIAGRTAAGRDAYERLFSGGDRFTGSEFRDDVYLGAGDDFAYLGYGNDAAYLGPGNDYGEGGPGVDQMYGFTGNDILLGGLDRDHLFGEQDNDQLFGNEGDDYLFGGQGEDQVFGNQGNDVIYGNLGVDTLWGGQGSDSIYGGQDRDYIYGNFQDDVIYGNLGDDVISGGQNNDLIFGNEGNDWMDGNRDNDTLVGGAGADSFVFSGGEDLFRDFNLGEGDKVVLRYGDQYSLSNSGSGMNIAVGSNIARVEGYSTQSFDANAAFTYV